MKYIWYFIYQVVQWTWGLLQSLFGLVLFFKFRKCDHKFYHGAIMTVHNGNFGGVSLGCFIFINANKRENIEKVAVHEFGHTIQSLVFGPLYLFVVGIPSFVWCNAKRYVALRQVNGVKYCSRFPENWANKLGEMVTGGGAIND
ncbi:MAG: hypothetical protein RSB20_04685 [Clostridia bacterium]